MLAGVSRSSCAACDPRFSTATLSSNVRVCLVHTSNACTALGQVAQTTLAIGIERDPTDLDPARFTMVQTRDQQASVVSNFQTDTNSENMQHTPVLTKTTPMSPFKRCRAQICAWSRKCHPHSQCHEVCINDFVQSQCDTA